MTDKEKSTSIISDNDGIENSHNNYIGECIAILKGKIEYLKKNLEKIKHKDKIAFWKPFKSTFHLSIHQTSLELKIIDKPLKDNKDAKNSNNKLEINIRVHHVMSKYV